MKNAIETDPLLTAKSVGLRYVNGNMPGIKRERKGEKFIYSDNKGIRIKDEKILARIKSLVIPPAWRDVWICPLPNGHLQATGYDVKGRKQYRYHPNWNARRNETKFSRMASFAKWLPEIRKKVEADLASKHINSRKIIAAIIKIMEKSCMRIGNREYAVKNQSYGLTTLRDRHVHLDGPRMKFEFKGKKGVIHKVELKDKRLARIVKHCRDIPGFELFQYYDENGEKKVIESGDVNAYLQSITGEEFSAKDFRTWAGTLHAFRVLQEMEPAETKQEIKKQLAEVVNEVSRKLGNTPAVCRKYYIHPQLLEYFENGNFSKFIESKKKKKTAEDEFIFEEKLLKSFIEENIR